MTYYVGGQWLRAIVKGDRAAVIYEAKTPKLGRSVVQVHVKEAVTHRCGRPVVQFLVVRVNKGVFIYEVRLRR